MERARGLRVPLQRDDERTDLVVPPVPKLLRRESLPPQPFHLAPDRGEGFREVRGIDARRNRPHPPGRSRVETRERVVREALLVPQVPTEATVQRSEERRVGKECRYRWW